jgi:hypothetical protein
VRSLHTKINSILSQSYVKHDEFFVRKCSDAIEILLKHRLILTMPSGSEKVTLVLKLNVAEFRVGQVDITEKLTTIASEYIVEKTLDLDNFCEIPRECSFVRCHFTRSLS